MIGWADIILAHEGTDDPSVLVTVGAARGSTPRETGAQMLVTNGTVLGTIGGGQLEYLAIERARALLQDEDLGKTQILSLPLGPELAQCCGGHVDVLLCLLSDEDTEWLSSLKNALTESPPAVLLTSWKNGTVSRSVLSNPQDMETIDDTLMCGIDDCLKKSSASIIWHRKDTQNFTLIEPINSVLFHLTLFGAGHVGKAVVHALSPLPCAITWIDERADMFPAEVPQNVKKIVADSPQHHVAQAPKGGFYLVMTHSHQLDLEICAEILKRDDKAYLGLIGSQTKRQKFLKRLKLRGYSDSILSTMTCPIGLPHLDGKHPAQIAISVSAEILGLIQSADQRSVGDDKTDFSLLKM